MSDHAMVLMTLTHPGGPKGPFRWHINEALLSDPVQCTVLETTLWEYFTINDTGEISPEMLWAAHKTVIRGKLIQITSQRKKERRAEITKLEGEFQKLTKQHKLNPMATSLAKLDSARMTLNLALTTETEKSLRWSNVQFYVYKDKIGPRLAVRLTPKLRVNSFPKVHTTDGSLTQNPLCIIKELHNFCSNLCKGDNQSHPNSFLNSWTSLSLNYNNPIVLALRSLSRMRR